MTDPRPVMGAAQDPVLLTLAADRETASQALWGWREAGLTVRRLRGRKMRTVTALFDETAAALQFPDYFGENWNAFDECLSDMDWLPLSMGIVLVVSDPLVVLADAPSGELGVLVRQFSQAWGTYAEPIELGEWWDRAAVPFHVVLHCHPDELAQTTARWTAAGAVLSPFPMSSRVTDASP